MIPKKITIPMKILYRKSSQNNPNQTKIKKSSLKIILTLKKKKDFLPFGYRENAGTPSFLTSLALGHDPPAPAPSSAPICDSLFLSVSLPFSLNLSMGTKRKEEQERKGIREEKRRRTEGNFLKQIAAICTNLTAQINIVCILNGTTL
jgi:hypothetical protein